MVAPNSLLRGLQRKKVLSFLAEAAFHLTHFAPGFVVDSEGFLRSRTVNASFLRSLMGGRVFFRPFEFLPPFQAVRLLLFYSFPPGRFVIGDSFCVELPDCAPSPRVSLFFGVSEPGRPFCRKIHSFRFLWVFFTILILCFSPMFVHRLFQFSVLGVEGGLL